MYLLVAAAAILVLSWWLPRLTKSTAATTPAPHQSHVSSQRSTSPSANQSKAPAISQPAPSPSSDKQDPAQTTRVLLEKIHDASVTYDPNQLPVIAEFLLHENPEVRKAAIDGMIVLGDSAAAPLLRQAALSAPTPQEAVALEEAAAYMELPSASLLKKR
jgi:hypothetical protein